jgi:hypothetical protein
VQGPQIWSGLHGGLPRPSLLLSPYCEEARRGPAWESFQLSSLGLSQTVSVIQGFEMITAGHEWGQDSDPEGQPRPSPPLQPQHVWPITGNSH